MTVICLELPTPLLKELDVLLGSDEEEFLYEDLFLEAELLIARLDIEDVPALLQCWPKRERLWQQQFVFSTPSTIKQQVLRPLLEVLLRGQGAPANILGLMCVLPKVADRSELSEQLVAYAFDLWHSRPEMRRSIESSVWSCGLSKRLLEQLGFNTWREARWHEENGH